MATDTLDGGVSGVGVVIAVAYLSRDRCVLAFDIRSERIIRPRLLQQGQPVSIKDGHALAQHGTVFSWRGRSNTSRPPPHCNEDFILSLVEVIANADEVRKAKDAAYKNLTSTACTTRSQLFGDLTAQSWKYVTVGTNIASVKIAHCRKYRRFPKQDKPGKYKCWMLLRDDNDEAVDGSDTSVDDVPKDAQYVVLGLAEGYQGGTGYVQGDPLRCYILAVGCIDSLQEVDRSESPDEKVKVEDITDAKMEREDAA